MYSIIEIQTGMNCIEKQWISIVDTEHWLLVETAIDLLKKNNMEADVHLGTIEEQLTHWFHFAFINFGYPDFGRPTKEHIPMALTLALQNATSTLEQFFAYYAITTLCFDDNGQEKEPNELYTYFFERDQAIMNVLLQYNPPMNEKYVSSCDLTQDKIDRVKRAAQRWLSCNNVAVSHETA